MYRCSAHFRVGKGFLKGGFTAFWETPNKTNRRKKKILMKILKKTKSPLRLASIVLALVLLISTLAATFAFLQSGPHRTGYLSADMRTFAVYLQKYERNASGEMTATAVKDAEFVLFELKDGDRVQHGTDAYLTNEYGRIMVEELPKGEYVFLETNPTYAYDFSEKDGSPQNTYPFVIDNDTLDVVYVSVYNQRRTADLTVTKTLKNSDDSALTTAQRDQVFTFTFTLTGDAVGIKSNPSDPDVEPKYAFTIDGVSQTAIKSGETFTLKHGQTAVFENLPVGAEYSIVETATAGYTASSNNHSGNIPREGAKAEFVNTACQKNGSLEISKTVVGEENSTQEFEFTVTFSDNGTYDYKKNGSTHTLASGGKLKLKHGESAKFETLPEGVTYTVTETATAGYIAANTSFSGEISGNVLLPFVNVKDAPTTTKGFLSITKKVAGSGANVNDEFTFNLTFEGDVLATLSYKINGTGAAIPFTNGGKITLKHNQTAVFADVAGLIYNITEDAKAGYTATLDEVRGQVPPSTTAATGAKVTFVNMKNPSTKLVVKKIVTGEIPVEDADKEFEFTVTIDGVEHTVLLKDGESSQEFVVEYGTEYEVVEKNYFADGYIKDTIVRGSGVANGEALIEVIQTNHYVGTVFVEIKGEKTWDMNGFDDVAKPPYITIIVKHGEIIKAQKNVTAVEDWKWSFNLPAYEIDGVTPIVYTVFEEPIPGYTTTINGYDITNKYEPVTTKISVPIKKAVSGNPTEAEEFKFDLQAVTAGAPMPTASTITINGEGTANFGDIIFAEEGTWVYTISEQIGSAAGYTYDNTVYIMTVTTRFASDKVTLEKTVEFKKGSVTLGEVSQTNPLVFTNAYVTSTPSETYYTPTVSKVVAGNSPATSPETFNFTIEPDNAAFPISAGNSISISGAGSANFSTIKFTEPGVFTYKIRETAGSAAGYTYDSSVYTLSITVTRDGDGNLIASASYSKDGGAAETTATFVNKHNYVPNGEPIVISGRKEWKHGANPKANQPTEIVITIKANGVTIITETISAANGWAWSFEVDRYDSEGKEIKYTIEENVITDYRAEYKGFSIINRHTSDDEPIKQPSGTVTISGKKTWNHINNPKSARPTSITVQLYNGNSLEATQTVTEKDDWKYTFIMPKYDAHGKEIIYRIDEVSVGGYGKYLSGYDITNTYGYLDHQTPPKTGEESNILLYFALMLVSGVLFAVTVIVGRRSKKRIS